MKFKTAFLILLLYTFSFSQPITGEADKLEYRDNQIVYDGNVKLIRGEAVLKANRVTIFLDPQGKPIKIVALGNVRYEEPGRKAEAQYAEYDLHKDLIILKGNAKVEEERSILEAEEIIYDRKKQTLQASGDRVRTIYIEEESQ